MTLFPMMAFYDVIQSVRTIIKMHNKYCIEITLTMPYSAHVCHTFGAKTHTAVWHSWERARNDNAQRVLFSDMPAYSVPTCDPSLGSPNSSGNRHRRVAVHRHRPAAPLGQMREPPLRHAPINAAHASNARRRDGPRHTTHRFGIIIATHARPCHCDSNSMRAC